MFRRRRPAELSADDVVLLYALGLGRAPSAEEISLQLEAEQTWEQLARLIAASDEHRQKRSPAASPGTQAVINFHTGSTDSFEYQPGTYSPDGSSRVGSDGHVFLVAGTNSILDQFRGDYSVPDGWEQNWRAVLEERSDQADHIGVPVYTLTVPDKLAISPEQFPDAIAAPGPRPAERLLALWPSMLYPVDELRACGGDATLRTDTHLTPHGNRALASALGDTLGVDLLGNTTLEDSPYLTSGDLGSKFNPPIVEITHSGGGFGAAELIADSSARFFAQGLHVGVRQHLRNKNAPDQRTVLIFGDSYARAADHYRGLAWYVAQGFANTHLVWIPFGWDANVVDQLSADLVISQGAERFVTRVPGNTVELQPYD